MGIALAWVELIFAFAVSSLECIKAQEQSETSLDWIEQSRLEERWELDSETLGISRIAFCEDYPTQALWDILFQTVFQLLDMPAEHVLLDKVRELRCT